MYFTKLKQDHTLPMALMRACPTCKQASVFINTVGDFAYKCFNPQCDIKHYLEFIPCMLQHRDFKIGSMNVHLGDEVWVDKKGDVDLDNPNMDIDFEEGPYKQCTGILVWDEEAGLDEGYVWLKCNGCKANYKTCILSYYGLDGPHINHSLYKMVEGGYPWNIVLRQKNVGVGKAHDVPEIWTAIIAKVRYKGQEIIYKKNELYKQIR